MSSPTPKRFTVTEVNHAIPSLQRQLEALEERILDLAGNALGRPGGPASAAVTDGHVVPPEYFAGIQEILATSRSLERRGIIVRDLRRGLVDFPAILDGKEVFLCWLRGEERVAFFHEPRAGFAGRRPLPPGAE